MKIKRERLFQLRTAIEQSSESLTDETAAEVPELFPRWSGEGVSYTAGDRRRYGEKLYKCLQGHTSQEGWDPESAPSLWAEILPGQDGQPIGEWVQPDSTNPYMIGDKVTHNGRIWESTIDGNVWEPGVYGWDPID